jgi:SNF2 family DNA or RNA helicase
MQKIKKKISKTNKKNRLMEDKFFFYYHKMTGQMCLEFPDVGCHINFYGGLLADEMGLGKTILMLSVIGISKMYSSCHQMGLLSKFTLNDTDKKAKIIENVSQNDFSTINKLHSVFKIKSKSKGKLKPTGVNKGKVKRSKTLKKKKKRKKEADATLGGNLIIVPTILMAQWEDEIRSFFKKVSSLLGIYQLPDV